VDVIVTNPPFGGMEEDCIESNYPAEFRTRETADLFLVLLMKILKPGGRAGLVLPDGTLFGKVDHLLPEYEKLLAQIAATRAALKQELHHALTHTDSR
jgi:type I restriction-modification system DNA methylase subunit